MTLSSLSQVTEYLSCTSIYTSTNFFTLFTYHNIRAPVYICIYYDNSTFILCTDNRRELNKVCDALGSFEVTRKNLSQQAETEVDSTTEEVYSSVKKLQLLKKVASGQKTKTAMVQDKGSFVEC